MPSKVLFIQFLKQCLYCDDYVVVWEIKGLAEVNHMEWVLDIPLDATQIWCSNESWSKYDREKDHVCGIDLEGSIE